MAKSARDANPRGYFYRRMRKHFGVDPATLVLVSQRYQTYEWPNVHLALQKVFSKKNVKAELEGILVDEYQRAASLAKLSRQETAQHFMPGPVEYRDVEVAGGQRLSCVERGLYWVNVPSSAVAVLISQTFNEYPPAISIEVMGTTREAAEDFGRTLATLIGQAPAFRGHVLSLETGLAGGKWPCGFIACRRLPQPTSFFRRTSSVASTASRWGWFTTPSSSARRGGISNAASCCTGRRARARRSRRCIWRASCRAARS